VSRHLIAKMTSGRRKTAGWADWNPHVDEDGSCRPFYLQGAGMESNHDHYFAHLENGHKLEVMGFGRQSINAEPNKWAAFYHDGQVDKKYPNLRPEDGNVVPNPDHHPSQGNHFWPSKEHAMHAAENAYQQSYPIGTNTGPHDSGTDYSDLNKFMEGM
jgi:hypothetical protein